jgi:putative tryptophan/tyrosine transport system substrate-binding protein
MHLHRLKRRGFITLLGAGAAAWPLAAGAQRPAMPVVGFLHSNSPETEPGSRIIAFRHGLNESGYIEGQNVMIEYRWAEGRYDRYSELITDLIRRKVSVIVTGTNTPASLVAKAATSTIPILFGVAQDPVRLGLVASLARPGGNATGVNFYIAELAAKRLGLLREMMPGMTRLAVLVNPTNAASAESTVKDVQAAAPMLGLQIQIFNAGTSREIDEVFTKLAREQINALFVGPDPLFNSGRVHLAVLAARHAIPATYGSRDYVEAGGLMSYGSDLADSYRQLGAYTGRILKGANPADLPVVQTSKLELVINAQTARTLGLDVPPTLLARADEVIE